MNEEEYASKYHRKEPLRKFNVDQTMYDLVMDVNENNMKYNYSSYFGNKKRFIDLKNEADKFAIALHRDGVKDEDVVAVAMLITPEVSPILLGINKLGATSYWLDARVKPADLIHYLNDNKVKELVVFDALVPMINAVINQTGVQRVVVVNIDPKIANNKQQKYMDERFVDYYDFINVEREKIPTAKYDREKTGAIIQSSGSTGKSKSIIHTTYNFNREIERMSYLDLPFFPKKRALITAPPWVVYGLVNSTYSSLVFGGEAVYPINPTEDVIYSHIGEFDYVYGVPAFYRYLYNKMLNLSKSNFEVDKKELERLREELFKVQVLISGGDKISEEDTITWQQAFMTPVVNGYGNNEVVGAAIVTPMFASRPGSIGVPIHGDLVRTFDPATGEMLPKGELGEVAISSDSLFKGYVDNEEETKKILKEHDGRLWVHTGDLGYMDKDEYIYLTGRSRRLIIDKIGYKISPDNSENFIQSIPQVKECIVVGVEVAENDNVPMAFIELKDEYKDNPDLIDYIIEQCKLNIKDYERPKLYKEIEKMPHKENGGKQDFLALETLAKEYVQSQKKEMKLRLR